MVGIPDDTVVGRLSKKDPMGLPQKAGLKAINGKVFTSMSASAEVLHRPRRVGSTTHHLCQSRRESKTVGFFNLALKKREANTLTRGNKPALRTVGSIGIIACQGIK